VNASDLIGAAGNPGVRQLLDTLETELAEAITLYWRHADQLLEGGGIALLDLPPELLGLNRNFFSALFLYSYHRARISRPRRIMYAAINHCLRGMVTGCDNLLDDEYKPTLLTDLPEKGVRFRSVLDIMVSDRVLFEILLGAQRRGELDGGKVLEASAETLRALTRSGVQEAGEEHGIESILAPEDVLARVHHYKTGLLFQCPWAVPRLMESLPQTAVGPVMEALYQIGIGCQIMDDMVDFAPDIAKGRHNYLVALIHHGPHTEERERLQALLSGEYAGQSGTIGVGDYPLAVQTASRAARHWLNQGLLSLLAPELYPLIPPVIAVLATLIGAATWVLPADHPC
jgi:hypothetical protein